MEKTKPTPTLAELYVSQQKFAYALAIYLYLQEKERKSYREEIVKAVEAITNQRWEEYPESVRKAFKSKEIAALGIVPEELLQLSNDALGDIKHDFGNEEMSNDLETAKDIEDIAESQSEDDTDEKEQLITNEKVAEEEITEEVQEERDPVWDEIENEKEEEELDFPKIEGEVYREIEEEKPTVIEAETEKEAEELVPGVKDFENNYKEEVTRGLLDESDVVKDKEVEEKIQDNINDKLVSMLRSLRSMNSDELKKLLRSKLAEGKNPEDLTLADLEELID